MNVLVTGALGQLGLSVRDASVHSVHEFIYSDVRQGDRIIFLDITDPVAVGAALDECSIDVIINCAAYTDVNKAEIEPETAYLINEKAVSVLAAAAFKRNVLLIHVSTDYVFDGNAHMPYAEDAMPSPISAYGKSKLAGENAIKASGCRYLIFRTAWLYSNYGKNFYKTILALTSSKSSLSVVSDQIGTPTWAADLAQILVAAVDKGECGGIYHYSNDGVCSWYDFAKEIAEIAGHDCKILPCTTEEYPTPAARPRYSVLDKTRVKADFGASVPCWKESLRACMKLAD